MKREKKVESLFDMGSGETTIVNVEVKDGVAKMSDPIPVSSLMRLSDFVENPDNPQTITDRAFDRLIEKVERIPSGLTAKRIAYVTDHPAGKPDGVRVFGSLALRLSEAAQRIGARKLRNVPD